MVAEIATVQVETTVRGGCAHGCGSVHFTHCSRPSNGLTKNRKVNPDAFARMVSHHTERKVCEIVRLVATGHIYNMANIGPNLGSDGLYAISAKKEINKSCLA